VVSAGARLAASAMARAAEASDRLVTTGVAGTSHRSRSGANTATVPVRQTI